MTIAQDNNLQEIKKNVIINYGNLITKQSTGINVDILLLNIEPLQLHNE